MVNRKKNRNKRKLQDLGLVEKTPTPKRNSVTANSTSNRRQSPRVNVGRKNARRKIMQSPTETGTKTQKKVTKKVKSPKKIMKCPYNHKSFSANYNEEHDKRYVGEGYDLFEVRCFGCKKEMTKETKKNCIVPTIRAPMYVCQGRQKYECRHCFCYGCYQKKFMNQNTKRASRRRAAIA